MELERAVQEYVKHDSHLKFLNKIVAELKENIKKAVIEDGTPDNKGHKWLQSGRYLLQVQKRQGDPFLDKAAAEEWAKEKGIWPAVSKTVEVLDEDALMAYMFERQDDKDLEKEFQNLYVTPEPTFAMQKPVEDDYNDY